MGKPRLADGIKDMITTWSVMFTRSELRAEPAGYFRRPDSSGHWFYDPALTEHLSNT